MVPPRTRFLLLCLLALLAVLADRGAPPLLAAPPSPTPAAPGAAAAPGAGAATSSGAPAVRLPKHVLGVLPKATKLPRTPQAADETLTLTLLLNRDDQAGFDALVNGILDPTSSNYRHYVSQTDLTARFGPSQQDYNAVLAFLQQNGFTLSDGSANRLTISVRGTRAQAERAFAVSIDDYQLGSRTFFANDTGPALPAAIAPLVQSVSGLSNLGQPQPAIGSAPRLAANPSPLTSTSAATAYDWGLTAGANGAGWTIGLLEFDNFTSSDVSNWLNLAGLPPGIINQLSEINVNGGTTPSGGNGTSEVLLDIAAVMGIAQGSNYVVADAPGGTPYIDNLNSLVNAVNRGTGASKALISSSWSTCEYDTSLSDAQSLDSLMFAARASDINFYSDSDDYGATCVDPQGVFGGGVPAVPADAPNGTAVGGTNLQVSAGNVWQSESWWGAGCANQQKCASGFGVSVYFTRPSYQNGFTSVGGRSVPDVVAESTPGISICQATPTVSPNCGGVIAGTSLATPLWAAMVAVISSQRDYSEGGPAVLYAFGNTNAFHSPAGMTGLNNDFAHLGLGSPDLANLAQRIADGVQVTGVTPGSGPVAGGTPVTITGGPFNITPGALSIYFASGGYYGVSAPNVSCQSVLQCTATTLARSVAGVTNVAVVTPATESSSNGNVYFNFVPSVTGISPSHGPIGAYTSVTISGAGFSSWPTLPSISFGTVAVPAANISCSSTSCTALSPEAASPGTVDVTVTVNGVSSPTTTADQFTYDGPAITSISPTFGPLGGGTLVSISGTGLGFSDNRQANISIAFGPNSATGVSCQDGDSCVAYSPPGSGTVDIIVTVNGVASTPTLADQFTYLAFPTVTGLSPTNGPATGGTTVTITGTNFSTTPGATSIAFVTPDQLDGTAPATNVACTSTTRCTATSPAGVGTVDVTATVAGATSSMSSADQFGYAPVITGISPTSGPATGGTSVAISGAGLSNANGLPVSVSAAFGTTLVSAGCASSTSCTATSPLGSGTVDVRITFDGLTSAATAADQFTYQSATTQIGWTDWSLTAPAPPATTYALFASVYNPADKTVLFVDDLIDDSGAATFQTWTWDGSSQSWTLKAPVSSPSVRTDMSLVYDAAHDAVLLFGGRAGYPGKGTSGIALNDTWLWNGTTWTQQHPSTSPPARQSASLAFDGAGNRVLLFGGFVTNGSTFGDTWTWDGTTWTHQTATPSPPARWGSGLAFDAATQTVVLFGGCCDNTGKELNDTWVWSQNAWSQQNPATSPSTRQGAGLAYDGTSGELLLFGGCGDGYCSTTFADTWLWNGNTWTQQHPTTSPPAQMPAGLSPDTALGGVEFEWGSGVWTWQAPPRGDVNGDGIVNATDALCVLRIVANLAGSLACPNPARGNPDVNNDPGDDGPAGVDSVDALCILRHVASLSGTLACPVFLDPAGSGSARQEAAAALPSAQPPGSSGRATAVLHLTPSAFAPARGRSTTTVLSVDAGASGLGAWTVDVAYDPAALKVTGCTAADGGICNPDYAPEVIRITGASASGLVGTHTLASIGFERLGHGGASPLMLTPITLTNPAGEPEQPLADGGSTVRAS